MRFLERAYTRSVLRGVGPKPSSTPVARWQPTALAEEIRLDQSVRVPKRPRGHARMIAVRQEDVVRALKKFRRLAKQDLLASERTSEPDFWRVQAEVRRETYARLIEAVEQRGVDAAYREAVEAYAALPLLREGQKGPAHQRVGAGFRDVLPRRRRRRQRDDAHA